MDPSQPLSSVSRTSGIPRLSKLPRPQSTAIPLQYDLPGPNANTSPARDVPRPVTPQRAPLQKVKRPLSVQPTWQPAPPSSNGISQTPRIASQQENAAELAALHASAFTSTLYPTKTPKKTRPSLSDRAIETISNIPPSPATNKRRSSFFSTQSPMTPRPKSVIADRTPAYTHQSGRISPMKQPGAHGKSSASSNVTQTTLQRSAISAAPHQRAPTSGRNSPSKLTTRPMSVASNVRPGSVLAATRSTATAKPPRSRGGLIGTFESADLPNPLQSPSRHIGSDDQGLSESNRATKSSAALRDQIAKAKAARRDAVNHKSASGNIVSNETSDFQFIDDPFNQGMKKDQRMLEKRINSARLDGRLNISAMGLQVFPDEITKMYDSNIMEAANVPWSTAVDLVRLMAADNDFNNISDDIFPAAVANPDDEENVTNVFLGLETLDFHGNRLSKLPAGLNRLQRLTHLNLSRNKFDNSIFELVSQLPELRDLQLAENELTREVPTSIEKLTSLESLNLRGNKISSLPPSFRQLAHLKTLDISNNRILALPMDILATLPLREINASTNAFTGALFDMHTHSLPFLQVLDVSSNSIVSLSFSEKLDLPALITLNVSQNRLTLLPDVSSWKNLVSLNVDANSLSSVPEGFTSLINLTTANFTGNSLVKIDEGIANMKSLQHLILSGNPLRERKFLTMSTDDVKGNLKKRLESFKNLEHSNLEICGASSWELKPNGTLDLSSNLLENLLEQDMDSFITTNSLPRTLILAQNRLDSLPAPSLNLIASTLTVLDISRNALAEQFLWGPLALPALRELNLSGNRLTSLNPLLAHLTAPSLTQLDVSRNRLGGALLQLRVKFPQMTSLSADDNAISEVSAASLHGMQVVSLRGNDLTMLDPEIGLLDEVGLRSLEVRGNKFRVPSHNVLDKGTSALMEWLRLKLP